MDKLGCETPQRWAAARKLRVSSTAKTYCNWRSVTGSGVHCTIGKYYHKNKNDVLELLQRVRQPERMTNWEQYKATMTRSAKLWDAAKSNDLALLDQLLAAGAPIDEPDSRGFAPLMLAAYAGHLEACRCLIDHGANADTQDASGNTALMGAAFKGHLAIVRLLLSAGADPKQRNQSGLDAKGFASMFGRNDVVALLGTPLAYLAKEPQ
jgi:ankyrin repeat protein